MNLLHQQVNQIFLFNIFKEKKLFLFILDTDNNKNLNSDLSSTDNSNSQLSRILQPTTKPIDVK